VITDTTVQSSYTHVDLATMACAGGADVIQLRDKGLSDDELTAIAREVRRVCDRYDARFIVNDRVEVAKACGADGVHLGLDDMGIEEARGILGENAIIGATAHSFQEALRADRTSADYLGFGHVYATTSKQKEAPPVGLEELARVCAAVTMPVLAIGGITSARVADVLRAGAWGVAVIADVCADDDPRAATEALRRALDGDGSEAGRRPMPHRG
jgi:thiamine-phosphate pyrophosphorylase